MLQSDLIKKERLHSRAVDNVTLKISSYPDWVLSGRSRFHIFQVIARHAWTLPKSADDLRWIFHL